MPWPAAADVNIWAEQAGLAVWTLDNLESYWRPLLDAASRFPRRWSLISLTQWGAVWIVLGISRLHYTLATGEICSKEAAGRYALQTFPEQWHGVIQDALRIRQADRARADFVSALADIGGVSFGRRREAIAFGYMVIADAQLSRSGAQSTRAAPHDFHCPAIAGPLGLPESETLGWYAACTSTGGMRLAVIAALVLLPLGTANAVVSKHQHPYRKHWKHATFGKQAVTGVAAGASVAQLRHSPRRVGGGAAGFGKRLGSGFATHAVKTTVEHAVAAPLHEDLHYHRSTKHGFGPRLGHALKSTVITSNTKTGKHTPAAGRIAGNAVAGAASQVWLSAASGASTAGVGLAADAGANVVREFWPRHHKRGHRHHAKRAA